MSEKANESQAHINSMHRLGRIGCAIAIIVMLGMPTIAGLYFDAMPSVLQVLSAAAGLLAIFIPLALTEVISYTPVLGSSIYLTLITGNVMNLKLPVANNALKLLDVESGTENADIISSIAVSVSSFATILIIALGVLLMIPLQPLLSLPSVRVATSYILPALFGSMALGIFSNNIGGGMKAKGRFKGAVIPIIFVAALTLLDNYVLHTGLISMLQGVIILLMLPVAYYATKRLYKKGAIIVTGANDNTLAQTPPEEAAGETPEQ